MMKGFAVDFLLVEGVLGVVVAEVAHPLRDAVGRPLFDGVEQLVWLAV